MKKLLTKVQDGVVQLLPRENENPENRYFKIIIWGMLGVFALGILAGSLGFFLTLRGAENTMVPNLEGETLVSALEELQSRGLNVRVQQRFSNEAPGGEVLDQSPNPGSQVRVGRTINLTISRGPVVDQVGDYVGLSLDDLRRLLAAQFTNFDALLEVRDENISYVFAEEEQGTILSQEPAPGERLSGYTDLMLLVSRGPELIGVNVPEAVGLDYRQALGMLAVRQVPFVFRYTSLEDENAIAGLVVSQFPEAGELLEPGTPMVLRINPPETGSSNERADIFITMVPEFALPVNIRVEFITPDGEIQPYFQTIHSGGELSFPYVAELGSQILVYADGNLLVRRTVVNEEPEAEGTGQDSAS